jgi:hypothetical protein
LGRIRFALQIVSRVRVRDCYTSVVYDMLLIDLANDENGNYSQHTSHQNERYHI